MRFTQNSIEPLILLSSNGHSSYRHSFQGQECDDEIKGEGNSINYSYRMHDPRIGRFFAMDPLDHDYPHNSPYAFSENRVIDGIELEGLEVVILFGGGDLYGGFGSDPAGGADDIGENIQDDVADGTTIVVINSNYWDPTSVVIAAKEEVMQNYTPGEPVIIYGYSYGGEYAMLLVEELRKEGIEVDLLVTVDVADGPWSDNSDRTVPDNVKTNINYYQTNPAGSGSHGGENTADDPTKTNVQNINLTDVQFTNQDGEKEDIDHHSIDEATKNKVEQKIIDATKGVAGGAGSRW